MIAIEPQPLMLERLQYNARVNSIRLDHVLECVVGCQSGTAMLKLDERNLGRSRVSDTGSLNVKMKTLLEIVRSAGLSRIDAIKVDVEGYEEGYWAIPPECDDALLPR